MAKNKSLKMLSTASVAGMVAAAVVSSQAFAAVDAYSVKVDNDVFQYSKADLTDSFLAAKAGEAAPLYEDFLARFEKASGFYAFHDNKTEKYVSVADITEKYLEAKAAGTEFVVDTYTESKDAKVLEVPTVKKVVVKDGKVVIEEDQQQVGELKVESVSAINLRQIEVRFNKDVDKATAEDVTNYKIAGTTLTANSDYAKVIDSRTVRITLNAAKTNLTKASFEVNNVKDTNDVLVNSYKLDELAFTDVTAPAVVSVEAVGPKDVKVTFNEPVRNTTGGSFVSTAASDFRINNGTIGIVASSTAIDDTTNSVTIKLGSELVEGENTIDINNGMSTAFQDYAGIALPKQAVKFNYVKDTSAPTVSVKSATPNKVVLKFSKEVKNVGSATIYHGYSSNGAATITPVPAGQTYADEWEVTFNNLLPIAETKLYIKSATTSGNEIQDRYGNKLADTNISAIAKADTVAPKVESITVKSPTKLEIKFSEDVDTSDVYTKTNYKFTKEDGTVLKTSDFDDVNAYGYPNSNVSLSYDSTKYVLTMNFSHAFKVGNYKLIAKDIKDKVTYQENKMAEQTIGFGVADNNAPKLSTNAYKNGNVVELAFSKDMATSGSGSVLDINNYQVKWNGSSAPTSLPAGSTVALGSSPKIVRITLGASSDYVAGATAISASVKDVNGVQVDSFNNKATVNNETAITASDFGIIKLVDKTTVKFELKRPVRLIDTTKLSIAGLQAQSVSYMNKVLSDGTYGAEVTAKISSATPLATQLTSKGNITTQALIGTDADPTNQIDIAANGIETEMGTTNSGAAVTYVNLGAANKDKVADYSAPYIKAAKTKDTDNDGMVDAITVTFSEKVRSATVNDATFKVDGYVASGVTATTVDGDEYTITVSEKGILDSAATPKVSLAKDVEDINGNATSYVGNNSEIISVDGVAPVVVSAVKVNATTIKVTLSEAVSANLLTDGTGWTVEDSESVPNNYAVSAQLISGKEVTLTVADISAAPSDVKVKYATQAGKNQDASSNDLASTLADIVVR